MGILNFEKLPVSTLVGADRNTYDRVMEGVTHEDGYRRKIATTKFVQRLLSPLYRWNSRAYERMQKGPMPAPVFIIGHWRSGTTYLHNILTQDERFGYCTTYQTVFPHVMLRGYGLFRQVVKLFMPSTRATDKMELGVDIPQEEEIALSNMTPIAHYHFLTLPRRMDYYRDYGLLLDSLTPAEREEFKAAMEKLVRISLNVQHKERFLSKNPPHTARISTLLELWPDAKFIYLVRNPYTVIRSTCDFFRRTACSTTLQHFDEEHFEEEVLKNYKALVERYERDKGLIPEGNLIEIRFEDVEADPIATTERIYKELSLGDFEAVRPRVEAYAGKKRGHKKNSYNYDDHIVKLVNKWCKATLDRWNYEL